VFLTAFVNFTIFRPICERYHFEPSRRPLYVHIACLYMYDIYIYIYIYMRCNLISNTNRSKKQNDNFNGNNFPVNLINIENYEILEIKHLINIKGI